MHRIAALAMLALLAAALPTQAQAPTPTSAVAITLDPGPAGIPLGMTHEIPFQVKLTLSNLACTQAATATVALSVTDRPSPLNGVKATAPATVAFTVPQGNYGVLPVSAPYEQTVDATLSISVAAEALPDHDHAFDVKGSFDGAVSGCQGAGPTPPAEGSALHQIKTGPAAAQGTARGATQSQGPSGAGAGADGGSKGAPGPGTPALAVLAMAVAAWRRRRA